MIMVAVIGLFLIPPLILPTRRQLLNFGEMQSLCIRDRNGKILREIRSGQDAVSHYCPLDSISPWLIRASLMREDKRFFLHRGIDPLATMRSLLQNIRYGEIVSGGSTITQQLARNMLHSPSRSILYKIMESLFAINLELKLNKREILELYFNYAPYGNQTYGISAASHLYFRKPARDLSLVEASYLAGIPKAPSYFNPYRHPERLSKECATILFLLRSSEVIDSVTYSQALTQPVHVIPKEDNFSAPHFTEFVLSLLKETKHHAVADVRTTLDLRLQQEAEKILISNIKRLESANVTNAAALIIDNTSLEILAFVGSVDFFDPLIDGEVDGVRSLRQPGSALKPFTYAIALEHGATAATLIPDLPTHASTFGGDYTPRNYDNKYHGMVRLRTALACSYNIPAVRVCDEFGTQELLNRLKNAGFQSLDKTPIHYGLGLTLGNGEVTLLELTRAFAIFSHGGWFRDLKAIITLDAVRHHEQQKPVRVFDAAIAHIISDILADNNARSPAFGEYSPLNMPFFCVAKTGTSKDFRDNWCVGFTDQYLVGIWVGNFDGASMHHVSGITGAGPIFRDIILMLHRQRPSTKPRVPQDIRIRKICPVSGELASPACKQSIDEIFFGGNEPSHACRYHTSGTPLTVITAPSTMLSDGVDREYFYISYPDSADIFRIDPVLRSEFQQVHLRIQSSQQLQEVAWYVDDRHIGSTGSPFTVAWQLVPGNHVIMARGITTDKKYVISPPVSILVLE